MDYYICFPRHQRAKKFEYAMWKEREKNRFFSWITKVFYLFCLRLYNFLNHEADQTYRTTDSLLHYITEIKSLFQFILIQRSVFDGMILRKGGSWQTLFSFVIVVRHLCAPSVTRGPSVIAILHFCVEVAVICHQFLFLTCTVTIVNCFHRNAHNWDTISSI